MNRIVIAGLCLVLTVSLAAPAWSQRGENNDYQAIKDEQNVQRRIQLMESFIDSYKNSQYRPDIDVDLMNLYLQNNDWAKILLRADRFYLDVPTADSKSRVAFYTRALVAAQQVKNDQKVNEFADRILAADPNDLNALNILTSVIMNKLPADGPAKDAALEKALGYSKRIQAAPRPATLTDDDWQRTQARAHSVIGFVQFAKGQFAEAIAEYSQLLKIYPKDAESHFRVGVSYFSLIFSTALPALQAAVKSVDDATAAKADQKKIDELLTKKNAAEKEVVDKRDLAIDALGKAVALGVASARPQLEALYKNKTGSTDTLDQFITQKKTELGL